MVFVGNYHGFNTYDIERADKPRLVSSVVCPGGQGDVSVHGNLLIMSVEQTRGRLDCGVQGVQTAVSSERFRGVRIFDISDISRPKQVAAVQTCRGSHTHTLVVDPERQGERLRLRVGDGHRAIGRRARRLLGARSPKEDPNTALFSIDVIQVPLPRPRTRRASSTAAHLRGSATGAIAGLWQGGNHGEGTQTLACTNQCHDITVFPGDRTRGRRLLGQRHPARHPRSGEPGPARSVVDKNFAYWHSATFNNDGTKVIFTDEWGGGSRPRCRANRPADMGRQRDLRHRRSQAALRELLQDAGAADRAGELRRAQRLAHPCAGPRHHGAGVVPGRRLGVRLHGFGAPGRDRVLRSRAARRRSG